MMPNKQYKTEKQPEKENLSEKTNDDVKTFQQIVEMKRLAFFLKKAIMLPLHWVFPVGIILTVSALMLYFEPESVSVAGIVLYALLFSVCLFASLIILFEDHCFIYSSRDNLINQIQKKANVSFSLVKHFISNKNAFNQLEVVLKIKELKEKIITEQCQYSFSAIANYIDSLQANDKSLEYEALKELLQLNQKEDEQQTSSAKKMVEKNQQQPIAQDKIEPSRVSAPKSLKIEESME